MSEQNGHGSIDAVVADFRQFMNNAFVLHGLVQLAVRRAGVFLSEIDRVPENPDPTFFFGSGDPNDRFAPYAEIQVSAAIEQLETDGAIETRFGQQWLVFVFTAWEHEYRERLAVARSCDKTDLKFPLFGDLRLLRNDVVHHHGIASAENAGRCDVVGHWVRVGEPIYLGGREIAEFASLVPWDELSKLSL